MAIAYTSQKCFGTGAGNPFSATVPAGGFTAGNKLLVVFTNGDASSTISSLTDTAGNTYSSRHQLTSAGRSFEILEADLTSGLSAGNTITASSNTGGGSLQVFEFSGLATGNSLDQQAAGTGFNTFWTTSATGTTTQADELLFGVNVFIPTSASATSDSPYTEIDESSIFGLYISQVQYAVVSATGTYTSSGTYSTSGVTYQASIDTFKAAGAAPADTGLAWIRA